MSNTTHNNQSAPVLAVRPREAARILGIGVRMLWSNTSPRGEIPSVRIGRAVLYRPSDLDAWLAAQAGKAVRHG
ncbi:MAG TPA: helix-turn-helix domain-containing protein [Phycisphaerales bacterium]|nr:helix-turn-helix domain-containing protein [Phycisphaerales bacterium]